jgi:hypothetical protein
MTPMQSAGMADQQKTWAGSLRISEVAQPSASSPERLQGMPYTHMLRCAFQHLLAGWKWVEGKRTQQLASRRLRLAETISLGEKRSVSIVQVDGAQYLIGCSSGSVQLLAVLDKQDAGATRLAGQGGPS